MKQQRTVSPLEILGAQKARRETASRLADAVAHILGAVGVTINATIQDGPGDSTTGAVAFSTYTYASWGAGFHQQAPADQEKIAIAHLENSIKAVQKVLADTHAALLKRKDEVPKDPGGPPAQVPPQAQVAPEAPPDPPGDAS